MERDILYGQGDGYTLQLLPVNPKALLNGCVDDIQFSEHFNKFEGDIRIPIKKSFPAVMHNLGPYSKRNRPRLNQETLSAFYFQR
jgi:hypothetical protein